MVFSSLIFLFLFLVLNLTIYLFVKDKYKNIVLLVFSLIFYAWAHEISAPLSRRNICKLVFRS